MGLLPISEAASIHLHLHFCPRSRLRIGSLETSSAVLSCVSPLILHTRAESSIWCLLMGLLPISEAASIHLHLQPPSGQSRVSRVAHLRTDDLHCGESPGRHSTSIHKVVPVFCATIFGYHHEPVLLASLYSGRAKATTVKHKITKLQ